MATGGATFRFVERGGYGNAMYHLLVLDEFDAAEALRCGLVQEVVPAGTQLDRARALADKISALAPLAIQATKASARLYGERGEQACIAEFRTVQERLANTEDATEGVRSFVERREPRFQGR
jgi:enoyl-CoA hydratase/carnithine racemase